MKLTRYRDTDTAYINLDDEARAVRTEQVSENVTLDYDSAGKVVAITVEHSGDVELA